MGAEYERFLKTSLLPSVFQKCLRWYRAFVCVSTKSLKLRGHLRLKGRRKCFEKKRLPTSGHVSRAWPRQPPPERQFLSLAMTHARPRIPKPLNKPEPPGATRHVCLAACLPPTALPLLISSFWFSASWQAMFLRSPLPLLQWHAQRTAPFGSRKTCENETTPDFLTDIILLLVTDLKCLCMLNLVLEKNLSWCSNCQIHCGGPWLVRRWGFLFWQFWFFLILNTCRVLKTWMTSE